MSFISLLLKFFLRAPGSPPHPPHLLLGEDHTLHPSTGVRGSSVWVGVLPLPSPPPQLCLPGAPLALVTPGCWTLRLCG